jgi:hypothetical protein
MHGCNSLQYSLQVDELKSLIKCLDNEWDSCLSDVNGKCEKVQELAAVGQKHPTPSVGMIT